MQRLSMPNSDYLDFAKIHRSRENQGLDLVKRLARSMHTQHVHQIRQGGHPSIQPCQNTIDHVACLQQKSTGLCCCVSPPLVHRHDRPFESNQLDAVRGGGKGGLCRLCEELVENGAQRADPHQQQENPSISWITFLWVMSHSWRSLDDALILGDIDMLWKLFLGCTKQRSTAHSTMTTIRSVLQVKGDPKVSPPCCCTHIFLEAWWIYLKFEGHKLWMIWKTFLCLRQQNSGRGKAKSN